MQSDPFSDVVSSQYERWMYPQPILDLPKWLISNWQWFDPSHSRAVFWPDGIHKEELDILVAGCGTNQAAVLAFTNPKARITAIDVSRPSLEHHEFLKRRYDLQRLELRRLPIEEVHSLNRDFDLIISTGVLHHLADPQAGMNQLARCLRKDGVMAVMLYARYGRLGVEMMQAVFKELGLKQTDASVLLVKEALARLPDDHPVRSYMRIAPDLKFDAGLVDTFLHGRDRSFSVEDCLELVRNAGLVFQDWFMKAPYHAMKPASDSFTALVAEQPDERQWRIMEKVGSRNACHFFLACHPERPESSFRVDFRSDSATSYVPKFRYRCGLNGKRIYRQGWSFQGSDLEVALGGFIDGNRSIEEIGLAAAQALYVPADDVTRRTMVLAAFEKLWKLDVVVLCTPQGKR